MTLVSSRVALKHLCTIERNSGAPDSWGSSAEDWQTHLTALPCRAWSQTARERVSEGSDVVIETRGMLVPAGTDVDAITDRVTAITDQDGNVYLDGPMRIHAVIPMPGHIELALGVAE